MQGALPPEHNDVLVVAFAASQAEPEWLGVPLVAADPIDPVVTFGVDKVDHI